MIVAACAHTDPCLRPHRPGVVPGGTKRPERGTTGKGRQATSRIRERRPSSINMCCLITLERSGTLPGIVVTIELNWDDTFKFIKLQTVEKDVKEVVKENKQKNKIVLRSGKEVIRKES